MIKPLFNFQFIVGQEYEIPVRVDDLKTDNWDFTLGKFKFVGIRDDGWEELYVFEAEGKQVSCVPRFATIITLIGTRLEVYLDPIVESAEDK